MQPLNIISTPEINPRQIVKDIYISLIEKVENFLKNSQEIQRNLNELESEKKSSQEIVNQYNSQKHNRISLKDYSKKVQCQMIVKSIEERITKLHMGKLFTQKIDELKSTLDKILQNKQNIENIMILPIDKVTKTIIMKTVKQFDELQSKLTEIKPIQSTIYNLKQDIDNYQIDNNYDMQIFPIFKQEEMELEGLVDDFLKDINNINDISKKQQKMQNNVELRQIHKKENYDSEESIDGGDQNDFEQKHNLYNNINNNNQMDIIE